MKSSFYSKIFIILFLLFVSNTQDITAQDTLSLPAVTFASMVTDGNLFYVFGGVGDTTIFDNVLKKTDSVLLNDVSVFETNTNKWEKEEPSDGVSPEARTYQRTVYDPLTNSLYVIGGMSGDPILTDIWNYDIESKTWIQVPDINDFPPVILPTVTSTDDGFFITGGKDEQGNYVCGNYFFVYSTNTLTTLAPPPADRPFDGAISANIDGDTFIIWGGDNNPYTDEVWSYNITTDTWTSVTTTGTGPQNKRGKFFLQKVGDKIYIGGGTENYLTKMNDFYSLDLTTHEWAHLANLPKYLSGMCSATKDGKIYIYGGTDENSNLSNDLFVYNPPTDTWSESNPQRVYPCKAPTDLTIQQINDEPLAEWKDNSAVEDGYVVERKTGGNNLAKDSYIAVQTNENDDWTEIARTGPNVESFTDETAVSGNEYTYRICAYNFAGKTYSEEVQFSYNPTGVEENNSLPLEFSLSQNYPNPFNPVTTIKYQLSEFSQVQIIIYNSLGQEVEKLINTNQNAGEYSLTWKANKYSSGVYYCQIDAAGTSRNFSKAIMMLLIK